MINGATTRVSTITGLTRATESISSRNQSEGAETSADLLSHSESLDSAGGRSRECDARGKAVRGRCGGHATVFFLSGYREPEHGPCDQVGGESPVLSWQSPTGRACGWMVPRLASTASRSWLVASSKRRAFSRAVVTAAAKSRRRMASSAYARINFSFGGRLTGFCRRIGIRRDGTCHARIFG